MKRSGIAVIFIFHLILVNGQTLKPSIGIGNLPADSTPVCKIPLYLGSFYTSGLQAGDTAADFTLYDLNGSAFTLSNALKNGKPVLLVSGSYTCPVFRNKIATINAVTNTYGSAITTAVIYCVEAHPTDTSPYFGYVNTTQSNINAGILYNQPSGYGQRKDLVIDLIKNTALSAPLYIDGPCNNWWHYYGPAPNNAYLIDTNGIVFSKHGWFDSYPDDIMCDIDSLLNTSGHCTSGAYNGRFKLVWNSSDSAFGLPGKTLSVDASLVNTSITSSVLVEMIRLQNNLPIGWESSMCATVCYSTSTDSVTIAIAPMTSQEFHFYFYTGTVPASGNAVVGFRNQNDHSNKFTLNAYGFTQLDGLPEVNFENTLSVYPNPGTGMFFIRDTGMTGKVVLNVYNTSGERVFQHITDSGPGELDLGEQPNGLYFLTMQQAKTMWTARIIVMH